MIFLGVFLGVAVVALGFIVLVAFGGLNEKIEILEFQVEDLMKNFRRHENCAEAFQGRLHQLSDNINKDQMQLIYLYRFLGIKRNRDGNLEKIQHCKTCKREV